MLHIEWFIIDTLLSLIVGFVPGILLGIHLTRGFLTHGTHADELHLPRTRTQTLTHARMPRLPMKRDFVDEDELYYQ
jgi:hypothetical protein